MALFRKKFDGAPFGNQSLRFHPLIEDADTKPKLIDILLDTNLNERARQESLALPRPKGTRRESLSVDPRIRLPSDLHGPITQRKSIYGYKKALQAEKYTMLQPFRFRKLCAEKREMMRHLGPGTYELIDTLEDRFPQVSRGCIETLENGRVHPLKRKTWEFTPGPGNYGKRGVPQWKLEEAMHKSPGNIPLMGTKTVGHVFPPKITDCPLGPATYHIPAPIDQFMAHGQRGPIDMCTEGRTRITGKRGAATISSTMGPTYYTLPMHQDHLMYHKNAKVGKWTKTPRNKSADGLRIVLQNRPMWTTKETPGPSSYYVKSPRKVQSIKNHPFNQTSKKLGPPCKMLVPPARYYPEQYQASLYNNGHCSAFKSKTQTAIGMEKFKLIKERLRGKDIYPKEKFDHSALM